MFFQFRSTSSCPAASNRRFARSRLAVAAALGIAAGSAVASGGSVWMQYGHDAKQSNHNGTEKTLAAANVGTLVPVWGGDAASVPLELPAVHRGELLGATAGVGLAAVPDVGGAANWSVPVVAGSGSRCDLAVADGKVILHGQGAAGATLQVLGLPS